LALYRMFSSVGFGRRSKDQTSNAGRGPVWKMQYLKTQGGGYIQRVNAAMWSWESIMNIFHGVPRQLKKRNGNWLIRVGRYNRVKWAEWMLSRDENWRTSLTMSMTTFMNPSRHTALCVQIWLQTDTGGMETDFLVTLRLVQLALGGDKISNAERGPVWKLQYLKTPGGGYIQRANAAMWS
jgi:hypothetical protein